MNSHLMRRTAAAGLAVVALAGTAGCARHAGTTTVPVQDGTPTTSSTPEAPPASDAAASPSPSRAAGAAHSRSQAVSALGTAIDQAGAAASDQSSDLSASAGGPEGDPTS